MELTAPTYPFPALPKVTTSHASSFPATMLLL